MHLAAYVMLDDSTCAALIALLLIHGVHAIYCKLSLIIPSLFAQVSKPLQQVLPPQRQERQVLRDLPPTAQVSAHTTMPPYSACYPRIHDVYKRSAMLKDKLCTGYAIKHTGSSVTAARALPILLTLPVL
jgi:hypothetical protein